MRLTRGLMLLLAAACHRPLPTALGLSEGEVGASEDPSAVPTTRQEALAAVVRRDPLVRRPRFPPPPVLEDVGATALARAAALLVEAETSEGRLSRLQEIEDAARGTELTALVRGTRLGIAERLLVDRPDGDAPELADLAPLLTRLRPDPLAATRARHPLEALDPDRPLSSLVPLLGERWVLAAWLDGPDIPLGPVASALDASPFDAARASTLGRIVVARAEGRRGPVEPGLTDLTRATTLALQRVAADRHAEQGAWADTRAAASKELGADDPIAFLLRRAADRLIEGADDPAAAGGALLASAAARLDPRCGEPPCRGLDRVETIRTALRWDPRLEPLAHAWSVIALKSALDTLDVGHETVLFRPALVDLVDALVGTGAAAPPAGLLSRTTEEPAAWQLVGACVGDRSASSWEAARVVLGHHLANETRVALGSADPAWRPSLERILARAVP